MPPSFRPDTGPAPFTIADLTAPEAPLPTSNIDLRDWRAILEKVREKRAALASVLEHAGPIEVGPLRVSLRYPPGSFLVPQATEKSALLLLESIVREHFASPTTIDIEVGDIPPGTITVAQLETFDRKARVDTARRAVAKHPLVSAAIELLGAELRDVRLAQEPTAAR